MVHHKHILFFHNLCFTIDTETLLNCTHQTLTKVEPTAQISGNLYISEHKIIKHGLKDGQEKERGAKRREMIARIDYDWSEIE